MDHILEQTDYKNVFGYFAQIAKIPRGSGNEKAISDYLMTFAKEHGLECAQDEANNVIMIKEASSGYENEPAIILQGHMDMVCEKRKEYTHDFFKDEIKLIVDGDFLHADGTTLGADDGIAVAYIMALLSDKDLKHPRLEAILTTEEETGMNGAKMLDLSGLRGQYLINLDSEEEGYLLSSCAGGLTGTSTLPAKRVSAQGKRIKLSVSGLQGGHSGMDIDKSRCNATKLLGRLLYDLRERHSFGLVNMQGGFKDNVIPREANAELLLSGSHKDVDYGEFQKTVMEIARTYQLEYASAEPSLAIEVEELEEGTYEVLHPVSFEKMLFLLIHMPNGVQTMSSDIEGLVESSLNLGIFHTMEDKVVFCTSVRSSKSSAKNFISNKLDYMVSFLGGDYIVRSQYPAWEYQKTSILRDHMQKKYHELTGKDMKIEAIHAGLECGLILEKIPGIDVVSIGPDMSAVHTIEEKVSISSTLRVYQFLEKVIEDRLGA